MPLSLHAFIVMRAIQERSAVRTPATRPATIQVNSRQCVLCAFTNFVGCSGTADTAAALAKPGSSRTALDNRRHFCGES
ncbi:hypothetical protein BDY19DRAFT_949196 [Irpex rosettiformis]|uniref:Uncharacterized protein n=1 Tax=Irpex rosettiformis TaxID=378272 RepID=A0ACB8U2U0_9APHY|nr:hypothetical protein BDY19DRAFT_949196 [Irpex rosettiformis]